MSEQIEGLAFSVEGLLRDADEIEGCGGGNEAAGMRWAAQEIKKLRTALATAEAERDAAHNEALEMAAQVAEHQLFRFAPPRTQRQAEDLTLSQAIAREVAASIRLLKKGAPNAE